MKTKSSDTFLPGRRIGVKLRLGRAVKRRRKEMGSSQEELAGRAGLHRTYISDIERGTRNPSLESIERIALALDISMSGLLEVTEPAVGNNGLFQHQPEITSGRVI
jgi:transcriptional regulator with XRE-family HTH domain